jgi:ketosteroid isomerase-like protein
MHTPAVACGIAALALACTPRSTPTPQWSTTDERAIRAVDSTYVAAWLRDDTLAVMNTLAPDAVLMPAGQHPLATPNDVRGFWWPADGSHTRILTFARRIDEIDGQGDVAWVRGTDTLTYTYDKGSTHSQLGSRSMTLALWRRQPDGAWRISRMMWGTRGP